MEEKELRLKLLDVKKDIETKSGIKFNKESVALADMISGFVAIKVAKELSKIQLEVPSQPVFGVVDSNKPNIGDSLYGE